jgi:ribosomal protein S18 acetylase RimI-like enzyme
MKSETTFDIGLPSYSVRRMIQADIPGLQKLYEACQDYMQMVDGRPAGKNAAEEEFRNTPPGRSANDKFMFGILDPHKELIGILDAMRGYPDETTWWIGLLLFLPGFRAQGMGEKVLEGFIGYVKASGGKAIMLGVVAVNELAYRFWSRMGFELVQEGEPTQFGNKVHIVRVMRLNLEQ